jgi:8-oxo-dGTP pyrophosphatase MutT (NUDIX family)
MAAVPGPGNALPVALAPPASHPSFRHWLKRVASADLHRAALAHALLPWRVDSDVVGYVKPDVAAWLVRHAAHVFEESGGVLTALAQIHAPAARSDALADLIVRMHTAKLVSGWRNERVDVRAEPNGPALFTIERAASRALGVLAQASHLTGFSGSAIWIARRASYKAIDPGCLDNLVGGRIATGYDADATMTKEAGEEAGLPADLAKQAWATGTVEIAYPVAEGWHRERMWTYEIDLPAGWSPVNRDGEVAAFYRFPIDRLIARIASHPAEMTRDAVAVTLHALLRRGVIGRNHPEYPALVGAIRPTFLNPPRRASLD